MAKETSTVMGYRLPLFFLKYIKNQFGEKHWRQDQLEVNEAFSRYQGAGVWRRKVA